VAYVVLAPGAHLSAAAMRRHLLQTLPSWMVPSVISIIEELPRNERGKVDRASLPHAGTPAAPTPTPTPNGKVVLRALPGQGTGVSSPRTTVEAELASIWAAVLGQGTVGVEDNFFDLGGHSLSAAQVVKMAAERGLQLSLLHIFEHQTIAAIAHAVHGSATLQTAAERTGQPLLSDVG
jgi:hypothetical protein